MSLQVFIEDKELAAFRKVLKMANRDYVLTHTEKKDDILGTIFTIEGPVFNSPIAFWHLGILDQKHRLSKRKK